MYQPIEKTTKFDFINKAKKKKKKLITFDSGFSIMELDNTAILFFLSSSFCCLKANNSILLSSGRGSMSSCSGLSSAGPSDSTPFGILTSSEKKSETNFSSKQYLKQNW